VESEWCGRKAVVEEKKSRKQTMSSSSKHSKMQNHHHRHSSSTSSRNSFAQWLKACEHEHSCLRQWSDRLIELGASWESFRNDDDDDKDDDYYTLVQDLVNGGSIPLLAARNIVRIVTRAMRENNNFPMAIFWE
jgi:hypothetical protein